MTTRMTALTIVCSSLLFAGTLLAAEKAPLPWLGLAFTWAESGTQPHTLHVRRVTPGGPADKAGIRPGDIVTTVNGQPVDFGDELEFLLYLAERKPGERMQLQLVREGRKLPIVVVLGRLAEADRPKWQRNLEMARQSRARRESQRQ